MPNPLANATEIPITRVLVDPELQARATLNQSTVDEYANDAREASRKQQPWPFPPIHMVGGYLVDGNHRLEAAKQIGRSTILASEHPGTEDDAILAAVSANASHGLRRSREDVQRAVYLALRRWPDLPAREIARRVRVSPQTILNTIKRDRELAKAAGVQLDGKRPLSSMTDALKTKVAIEAAVRHASDYIEARRPDNAAECRRLLHEILAICDGWIRQEARATATK